MIAMEITSELTRIARDNGTANEIGKDPLFATQKIQFKATVEVGKTLVMLDVAEVKPAAEDTGLAPVAENKPREGLAIFLTPTKVEERSVEVYSDPTSAAQSLAERRRAAAVLQLAQAGAAQAGGERDAALANQLREVRMVLEKLAADRARSEAENAALKAQIEQLRAELQKLSPAASGEESADPRAKPLPASSDQRNPLSVSPRPVPQAKPSPRITRVYVFGGDKEATDIATRLMQLVGEEKLQLSVQSEKHNLIVAGSEAELAKIEPSLASAGKLALESRTGVEFTAPPDAPYDAVRSGLEWLRKHGVNLDTQATAARDVALQAQRQTERRLLELDLQAAEIELQAAQEDLSEAEQLQKSNTISAQEVRARRRAMDRARIQLERIKVQLQAVEALPADAARR